jgi:hypothetical protein
MPARPSWWWLLERWFGQPFTFGDLPHVAGFLVAAGLATATSAIGGAATMTLLHSDTTAPYWHVWREWLLSSWVGLAEHGEEANKLISRSA